MTISQAFELAFQNHRAGRLKDAEALYRQILSVQPNHAGSHHLLGVIAQQAGRHDLAVERLRQAIALNPRATPPFSQPGLPPAHPSSSTLRKRMQTSPLMDAPRFARNIEAAYRSLWHSWCAQKSPSKRRAPDPIIG
jgi:tetratricopeptide (TPR) repeat protein